MFSRLPPLASNGQREVGRFSCINKRIISHPVSTWWEREMLPAAQQKCDVFHALPASEIYNTEYVNHCLSPNHIPQGLPTKPVIGSMKET